MARLLDGFFDRFKLARCCAPAVTGLTAVPGGGSGEIVLTWNPLPASANVAHYRVCERKQVGTWQLAVVTDAALGVLAPGRLGLVDAADFWPWPSAGSRSAATRSARCRRTASKVRCRPRSAHRND
ncbi:MAG: hypothetical protein ACT4OX_05705 [Actinomycetota bacterium]